MESGKKVVTHENAKSLDTPAIRKELAQDSLPKLIDSELLSNFDKNNKEGLESNPKEDN